jgi:hypothetical protein
LCRKGVSYPVALQRGIVATARRAIASADPCVDRGLRAPAGRLPPTSRDRRFVGSRSAESPRARGRGSRDNAARPSASASCPGARDALGAMNGGRRRAAKHLGGEPCARMVAPVVPRRRPVSIGVRLGDGGRSPRSAREPDGMNACDRWAAAEAPAMASRASELSGGPHHERGVFGPDSRRLRSARTRTEHVGSVGGAEEHHDPIGRNP